MGLESIPRNARNNERMFDSTIPELVLYVKKIIIIISSRFLVYLVLYGNLVDHGTVEREAI